MALIAMLIERQRLRLQGVDGVIETDPDLTQTLRVRHGQSSLQQRQQIVILIPLRYIWLERRHQVSPILEQVNLCRQWGKS